MEMGNLYFNRIFRVGDPRENFIVCPSRNHNGCVERLVDAENDGIIRLLMRW